MKSTSRTAFLNKNIRNNKIVVIKLNYLQNLFKLQAMTGIRFSFNGKSIVVEFLPHSYRSNSRPLRL